ncbi:FAD-binding oxidoreductase [Nordella sp. HKS 07]|uniref:NAD(P)/FAD-dependent oxidoreductase n=1 Tax=Nordella sp. HKS 07 TaxID=2712222 RepID=UPI0013E1DA18|nr:FAD-binding oxidoreductase [Nordella sp. HKS 07]QIG51762.1 FAD-binding oxidoreductase [Nordella sp. HKS 07]
MTQRSAETWYEATAPGREAQAAPRGVIAADVCVIGGGLAGLTTAMEVQRRGRIAVLLEAKRIAWGASGRNGGFVGNGFALGVEEIIERVGLRNAQALYRLSAHGTEYVRREVARLDQTIRMGDGIMVAQRTDDPLGARRRLDMMLRDFSEGLELLSTEQTRMLLQSERYFQSLKNPHSFLIHPIRYARAFADDAQHSGVMIHENSPALEVRKAKGGFVVRTAHAEIHAPHVVHCVSSLDRRINRTIGRAVLPIATYVAVTEPLEQDAIRTRCGVGDMRRAGDYYRLISDKRLLWGGRITTRVSEPARLAEMLKRDMLSVFPQLGDPRIDYAWSGLMGYALHKMPLIGRAVDGQWFATAFGGHGLNTTAMAGILMARAIADRDDEYRRFAPFAPKWAGGPFGRIGVQASYWHMQLRDALDERADRKKRAMRE